MVAMMMISRTEILRKEDTKNIGATAKGNEAVVQSVRNLPPQAPQGLREGIAKE